MFIPFINIVFFWSVFLILRFFYRKKMILDGKEKAKDSKLRLFLDLSFNMILKAHENHFLIISLSILL
jgi:hypothetical protein